MTRNGQILAPVDCRIRTVRDHLRQLEILREAHGPETGRAPIHSAELLVVLEMLLRELAISRGTRAAFGGASGPCVRLARGANTS